MRLAELAHMISKGTLPRINFIKQIQSLPSRRGWLIQFVFPINTIKADMKFVASRLSEGNKVFPTEINCEEHGLTVKIPGLFQGESQYFDYQQISSIGVDSPLIGFSTITFYAGANFISTHGFTSDEVNQIKKIISSGNISKNNSPHPDVVKSKTNNNQLPFQKQSENLEHEMVKDHKSDSGRIKIYQVIDTRSKKNQQKYHRVNLSPDDSDIFEHIVRKDKDIYLQLTKERYPELKDFDKLLDYIILNSDSVYDSIKDKSLDAIDTDSDLFILWHYFLLSKPQIVSYVKRIAIGYKNEIDIESKRKTEEYNFRSQIVAHVKAKMVNDAISLYVKRFNTTDEIAKVEIDRIIQERKELDKGNGCLPVILIFIGLSYSLGFVISTIKSFVE